MRTVDSSLGQSSEQQQTLTMELSPVLSLAIVLLPILTSLFFFFTRANTASSASKDPSSITELIKNGHRILDWTTDLLVSSPTATITTAMGVITADPATVEYTLKARFDAYVKGDRSRDILYDLLGGGIFNSDGDSWKLQRRTASLEFSTKTIRTFVMANVRFEVVDRLIPFLASAAATMKMFDLQEVLELFAFDNVCKVVFDEDPAQLGDNGNGKGREFYKAFDEACNLVVERYKTVLPLSWKLRRLLDLGSERKLKQKIKIVHEYAMQVVKSRKESALGDDLVSRFIAEEEEYSDEFLRDIIVSFVLAGRDTTSATLTWFFWHISTRPDVANKIMDEIRRVRERTNSDCSWKAKPIFTLDQVRDMHYLHAALSETLRLYPPVPLQGRVSTEDDALPSGVKVRKSQQVMYNSYAMGRMERIWGADCREFRPERWVDERGVFGPVSPYQYPVFHAGPRMCLGKDMAYIQMKVVAASVMERFEVEVVEVEKDRLPELVLIMKMKDGLKVRVRERDQAH